MEVINYIKNCFNLYSDFEEGYKKIDKEVSFLDSFLVYFGITFLVSLFLVIQDFITTGYTHPKYSLILYTSIGQVLVLILAQLYIYGVTYGMLQFFGGKSNFKDTFKFGLSVGIMPLIVNSVLNIVAFSMYMNTTFAELNWSIFDIVVLILFTLISFGVFIWAFIRSIKIFEELHNLSKGKVIISILTPMIIGMLLFAALILGLYLIFA